MSVTCTSRGLGLCIYVYMKEAWIVSFSNGNGGIELCDNGAFFSINIEAVLQIKEYNIMYI